MWWKKYLTTAQIVQFCIDVPACVIAIGFKLNYLHGWGWFGGANTDCGCDYLPAAYFGSGLLLSYLLLFIQFFIETYQRGAAKRRERKAQQRAKKAL